MLKGRVALITGASRGIGAATARLLAAQGAAVGVNYLQKEELARQLVGEIEQHGGHAVAVQADVTQEAEVRRMVHTVQERLGSIDTLILNAPTPYPITPFAAYSWTDFQSKLVNELKAFFFCAQTVLPGMMQRKQGCIIAVSSSLSRRPAEGFAAHSTAKSALNGLVRALALELGPHGIRVNAVAPGLTMTDGAAGVPLARKKATAERTPLRRNGLPEDAAGAILLLAADTARFVTGTYLDVDGGISLT